LASPLPAQENNQEKNLEEVLIRETGLTGAELEVLRPTLNELEKEKVNHREVIRIVQASQKAGVEVESLGESLQSMMERLRVGDTAREARRAAVQTIKRTIREGEPVGQLRVREEPGKTTQEMTRENFRGEGNQALEGEKETLREETKGGKSGGNSAIPESPTPHEDKNGNGQGQVSPEPHNGKSNN
jgi:hypothetical protein